MTDQQVIDLTVKIALFLGERDIPLWDDHLAKLVSKTKRPAVPISWDYLVNYLDAFVAFIIHFDLSSVKSSQIIDHQA